MIARISCSRTSKQMSVSALTPPNVNDACSTCSNTLPICPVRRTSEALTLASRPGCRSGGGARASCGPRHRREGLGSAQLQHRRHLADATVLEAHLGLDVLGRAPGVQGIDQHLVLLRDEAPPHLARPGELVVV